MLHQIPKAKIIEFKDPKILKLILQTIYDIFPENVKFVSATS